jgi:hypothetical protein
MARDPFLRQLVRRNVVFLGSLVLRRDVFAESGGFDPRLRGAADWELILRLASRHAFAFLAGPPIAVYVLHPGGMSNDGDHMEQEFAAALVGLLERGHLSADDRIFVERALARQRFELAYQAYDRGAMALARRRFELCLQASGFAPRLYAYYAVSHMPAPIVRAARRLKARVGL